MYRTSLWGLSICVAALLACKLGDKQEESSAAAGATATAAAPVPAASAAATAPTNQVTFSTKVPPAGTKVKSTSDFSMKLTEKGSITRTLEKQEVDYEVKASDEFRVTKLLINVKDKVQTNQEGTKPEQRSTSPLAGSSYIVTRESDGKLSATDTQGNKVADSELALLKQDFSDQFEKDTSAEFLPKRPMTLGEKLFPPTPTMLRMLNIKDDGKTSFEGTEFLLESVQGGIATFHVEMSMMVQMPASHRLRAKLSGKMKFLTDSAWGTEVDLSGPLTLLTSTGTEKADGTMTVKATQSFQ